MIEIIIVLEKQKIHSIKLLWHNDVQNGGDYFGKWILEQIGYKIEYSNSPDIVVCGSILGINLNNSKIWGAGFHFNNEKSHLTKNNAIYAVRGRLSLKKLNIKNNITLGDPGLLLSRFFKPKTKKIVYILPQTNLIL